MDKRRYQIRAIEEIANRFDVLGSDRHDTDYPAPINWTDSGG